MENNINKVKKTYCIILEETLEIIQVNQMRVSWMYSKLYHGKWTALMYIWGIFYVKHLH